MSVTLSVSIDDMTLEELVQLSQGLGHQVEKLREQRAYLKAHIDRRLQAGHQAAAPGDNRAPGAMLEAGTQ